MRGALDWPWTLSLQSKNSLWMVSNLSVSLVHISKKKPSVWGVSYLIIEVVLIHVFYIYTHTVAQTYAYIYIYIKTSHYSQVLSYSLSSSHYLPPLLLIPSDSSSLFFFCFSESTSNLSVFQVTFFPHFPRYLCIFLKIQRGLKTKMAGLRGALPKPTETETVYIVKWFCLDLIHQELQQEFSETWHLAMRYVVFCTSSTHHIFSPFMFLAMFGDAI